MSKDDTAANDEVVADATATESPTVETERAAETDDGLEAIKDIPLDPSDRTETESEEAEAAKLDHSTDETDDEQQSQDEQPKSPKDEWESLNGNSRERFSNTINERNELRRQLAELQAKQAQLATEQDLLNEINPETGEYYSPQEIERISWQQSRQAEAERVNQELYAAQIQQNQASVNDEAARVVKDFPLVDPNSKDFVPEIGQQYIEALNDSLVYVLPDGQQANRSTLLANGINPDTQATLVGYNSSPYKLAKLAADAYARAKSQGEAIGQANAQRATEKMMANVDAPSDASSAGKSGDSLDDIFSRVKDIPLS